LYIGIKFDIYSVKRIRSGKYKA